MKQETGRKYISRKECFLKNFIKEAPLKQTVRIQLQGMGHESHIRSTSPHQAPVEPALLCHVLPIPHLAPPALLLLLHICQSLLLNRQVLHTQLSLIKVYHILPFLKQRFLLITAIHLLHRLLLHQTCLTLPLTYLQPFVKVNHSTCNPPIYNFLSYHRLSHYAFVFGLSSISIPKTIQEALAHPRL